MKKLFATLMVIILAFSTNITALAEVGAFGFNDEPFNAPEAELIDAIIIGEFTNKYDVWCYIIETESNGTWIVNEWFEFYAIFAMIDGEWNMETNELKFPNGTVVNAYDIANSEYILGNPFEFQDVDEEWSKGWEESEKT